MPDTILTKANERMPLAFSYIAADGSAKDLSGYTVTPVLYDAGTETVYLESAAAGTVTFVDQSAGTFQWLPAAGIFVAGAHYNLRFLFVSGDETFEKLNYDVELRVRS